MARTAHFPNNGVLVADIGGTNTRFAICTRKNNKPVFLKIFHYKTSELADITQTVTDILEYARIHFFKKISDACFAVAGPVSKNRTTVTVINARQNLSAPRVQQKTKLKSLFFINDFEAVGLSVNWLTPADVKIIKKGVAVPNQPCALIGAGTGLGKALLLYSPHDKVYLPQSSEGGHADFPVTSAFELELIEFIKAKRRIFAVGNEEIVSGRGIAVLYDFLRAKNYYFAPSAIDAIEKSADKGVLISSYARRDRGCRKIMELFASYYARCARNFALETHARGGVFIAGGIAPKNLWIFNTEFIREFENHYRLKYILKPLPLTIITTPYAGLMGACFALQPAIKKILCKGNA